MKCRQCSNTVRVNFCNGYCSTTCAGVEPKAHKRKRMGSFAVVDSKFVFVDAGVEPDEMPAHYIIEDATPEKLAKRHKEKVQKVATREALKREFKELRGEL